MASVLYALYINDVLIDGVVTGIDVISTGSSYPSWTYTGDKTFLGFSKEKGASEPPSFLAVGQTCNFDSHSDYFDHATTIYLYSVEGLPTYTPAQMAEAILNLPMKGVITTDATATASDIVSGKTAYVNEEKITGTLTSKSSSDLTVSGATVTVPAGYYSASASKSVATATHANPTASISSSGLITASHTQATGYVNAGTTTGTLQLTTQAAKTVTPTTSSQTAVASGRYTTGAVKLAAMPTATQATPTISVNTTTGVVTATSTQNSAGYISAGTKTATQQVDVWDGSMTVEASGGGAVTDLTGTSWRIDSLECEVSEGRYWVRGQISGSSFSSLLFIGYTWADGEEGAAIPLANSVVALGPPITVHLNDTITFAEGDDISNPDLIAWLQTHATQI